MTKNAHLEKVFANFVTVINKKPSLDPSENHSVKYVDGCDFFFTWTNVPFYKHTSFDGERQGSDETKVFDKKLHEKKNHHIENLRTDINNQSVLIFL